MGYIFGVVFITSAGFCKCYCSELVSGLKRLLLHYDNFSGTDILEEFSTCILQSLLLRGFLPFSSQFLSQRVFKEIKAKFVMV